MIQDAIINKPYHETRMISSISMRKPSKSSVYSLKIPDISNKKSTTSKSTIRSTRNSNRFTRKTRASQSYFRDIFKSKTKSDLIKLAKKTNTPVSKTDSSRNYSLLKKNDLIDNLLDKPIGDLYTITEELNNSSHNVTKRQTRSRLASTRKTKIHK